MTTNTYVEKRGIRWSYILYIAGEGSTYIEGVVHVRGVVSPRPVFFVCDTLYTMPGSFPRGGRRFLLNAGGSDDPPQRWREAFGHIWHTSISDEHPRHVFRVR